jgi:uncharacterized protein (TIRG00374 family)
LTVGALAYVVTLVTWRDRVIEGDVAREGWLHRDGDVQWFQTLDGQRIDLPADAESPEAAKRLVPGIVTIFGRVRWLYFLAGTTLLASSLTLTGMRWQWLLQSHGLDPGLWQTIRLTWVGYLANNFLPGATGGDFVKAFSIARRSPGKRTSAVMTVLLDRVVGLVALILMGAIGVLMKSTRDGFDATGRLVLLMLTVSVLGGILFFSRRVRKILRIAEILEAIPFGRHIQKIDDSLFHYREHGGQLFRCLLLGMAIWALTIVAIYLSGQSLRMNVAILDYFICLPIIFTAGAAVPAIAGLGILETLFQQFFGPVGAPASVAVALCILYRLMMLIVSIPGALPLYQEFSALRHPVPSIIIDHEGSPSGEVA